MCQKFSPYMHKLQLAGPQIPDLYMDSTRLLLSVLSCFLNPKYLPDNLQADKLIDLDLTKHVLDMPKVSPSATEAFRSMSPICQSNAKKAVIAIYTKTAKYLQVNLHPLRSKLVKSLRVLNPKHCEGMTDGGASQIVAAAKRIGRFSQSEIDSISLQWESLSAAKFERKDKERYDLFYVRSLIAMTTDTEKYEELWKFIKITLSLPCANAGVERGFSHSKRVVTHRESLSLASLMGQRIGLEVIRHYGGADKVEVTPNLIVDHNRARQQYHERIEKEKREKERTDAEIRRENELKRQREAEESEKVDYETKKKRFEKDEAQLRDDIKFAEVRLSELEERSGKTKIQADYLSALSGIKLLREDLRKKRNNLDKMSAEKSKLVEKYVTKMLRK